MAGVYSYLPLGQRCSETLKTLARKGMDAIGGQEIRMATLHPSEPWKQTGGWDQVDVLFKLDSRTEKEYALGQSEEKSSHQSHPNTRHHTKTFHFPFIKKPPA